MLKVRNANNSSYIYIYIYRCALTFFLLLLSSVILFSHPASATDIPTSVTIKPSLSLSIPADSVLLTLDPTTTPFASQDVSITVGTNNPTGYWLTMSSTGANNTSLINTVDDSYYLPTLPTTGDDSCSNGCTESNFPVNSWGYKVGTSTEYLPYTSGTTIASKSTYANNDTTTLSIASKVDYLKPSGNYKQTFTFTALPNITQYYMQDIKTYEIPASQICNEQAPTIVIDKRDEQAYMIQRLPDHKCWMLDNLNLDLTNKAIVEGMNQTNTNATDIALGYLRNGGGTSSDQWATRGLANNSTYAYANWVNGASFQEPLVNRRGSCNAGNDSQCLDPYEGNSYTTNTIIMPEEYRKGYGSYKLGTYYNYCAISAGSYCYNSDGFATGDAIYDICPSGWRLPISNLASEGGSNDYYNLITIIATKYPDTNLDASSPFSVQSILSLPFSGYYKDYYGGTASRQGDYGLFATSTRSTYTPDTAMRFLVAKSDTVNAWSNNSRHFGYSVRCLLQES